MPTLNLEVKILGYDTVPANSNPKRRDPDWVRPLLGIPVEYTRSIPVNVAGFGTATIFDGSRSLTANGATEYDLFQVLEPSRYRLEWTGTGAAPGFRTDRALTLSGGSLTVTLNVNQTVTLTHTAGAVFGAVVVGDTVLIPGAATGDTALFDGLNEGEWTVLAASATSVTLVRQAGTVFQGATEVVVITANDQVQAYGAAGVQVGDVLDIGAGFAATARHAYRVEFVTAGSVDFVSTSPLAEETAVPGATGIKIYSSAQRFVYLETDQEVVVRVNGATGDEERVEPIVPGDQNLPGIYMKTGTTYSMVVVNRSSATARVKAFASPAVT